MDGVKPSHQRLDRNDLERADVDLWLVERHHFAALSRAAEVGDEVDHGWCRRSRAETRANREARTNRARPIVDLSILQRLAVDKGQQLSHRLVTAHCKNQVMSFPEALEPSSEIQLMLLRRGKLLERVTLGWNIVGVIVLVVLAIVSSSVALAGFGLDSFIEIGASTVVLWELSGTGEARQNRALRLIGVAFLLLATYLLVQSTVALATDHHAVPSVGGLVWTAVTAVVMFTLALLKGRTGRALGNAVLEIEGRVTFVDGLLAVAVLVGILLDLLFGWWWADPVAGFVIVFYAIREAIQIFGSGPPEAPV
jgi:hypothetical protein